MNYRMDRNNFNNANFNQTENGKNLPPTSIPSNVPDGSEENRIYLAMKEEEVFQCL